MHWIGNPLGKAQGAQYLPDVRNGVPDIRQAGDLFSQTLGSQDATIWQSAKCRPNSDEQTKWLTERELALNKEVNGTQVVAEHAIEMIKRYRYHQALLEHAQGAQRRTHHHRTGEPKSRLGQDK